MDILTCWGDGGRQPGQFFGVQSIATDLRGNVYTTETFEGKRVQKFVNLGLSARRIGLSRSGLLPESRAD